MSNNTLRILTAVVGIPAILGLLYVGSWPFAALVLALSLLAQFELYGMLAEAGLAPYRLAGLVLGALLVVAPLYPPILVAAAAVLLFVVAGSVFSASYSAGSVPATVFGAIYPSGLLSALVALRTARGADVGDREAFLIVLTLFLIVWSTDTAAYYVGRAVGKRPLAPIVSPKKTWEGAVGGAVAAVVVAAVIKLVALDFLAWTHVLVVAVLCATFGQIGDLAESRMKRAAGIKDSGALLPGHGGILDRFDAMILAAAAVYLYLAFVVRLFGAGM